MTDKVRYAELTPHEFRQRIAAAPIAYLPLGTLEWHGEHLPLGADGIQSEGFFCHLAAAVGGIVLPMLFLGPDRSQCEDGRELYGMDLCMNRSPEQQYESGQLAGSAYWVPEEVFASLLDAVLKQLRRAGFRVVVGHGHGPSTKFFAENAPQWRERFDLLCLTCWGSDVDADGLGIQTDHAAANETSLVMALRPDLVQMDRLPPDPAQWPVAVGGRDPRVHAGAEVGRRAIALQTERMAGLLKDALAGLA